MNYDAYADDADDADDDDDDDEVHLEIVGLDAPDHHPSELHVKGKLSFQSDAVLIVVRHPTVASHLGVCSK